jgi:hypothetical protein
MLLRPRLASARTPPTHGAMNAMLLALVLLSVLGLRCPQEMLPLLFLKMTWKATWLLAVAFPAWRSGTMDTDISDTTFACLMSVVFVVIVPWDYVWRNFVTAKSERWSGNDGTSSNSLIPAHG